MTTRRKNVWDVEIATPQQNASERSECECQGIEYSISHAGQVKLTSDCCGWLLNLIDSLPTHPLHLYNCFNLTLGIHNMNTHPSTAASWELDQYDRRSVWESLKKILSVYLGCICCIGDGAVPATRSVDLIGPGSGSGDRQNYIAFGLLQRLEKIFLSLQLLNGMRHLHIERQKSPVCGLGEKCY